MRTADFFYPDFIDKAGVLIVRLAGNHPPPDDNKRAAWVALRAFVDQNRRTGDPKPTVGDAEQAVVAIAAGEWDEAVTGEWLRAHLNPPSPA